MTELVAKRCKQLGYKKVGLLGSPVTLRSGLYTKELSKKNIKLILPIETQRKVVDRIIRYVLAGESNEADKEAYIEIITDLISRGAEGVILGCTELPLAINYEALGSKVISSMEVLAGALVDYYYSSK
ncbi:aspartate/glutamate racemase family protein [Patescibacteria group bacterium]